MKVQKNQLNSKNNKTKISIETNFERPKEMITQNGFSVKVLCNVSSD